MKKKCLKCKTEKDYSEFHKDRLMKDGLYYYCRECCKIISKLNAKNRRDYITKYHREWSEKNRERCREYQKKYQEMWRSENKELRRKGQREYMRRWVKIPKNRIDTNMGVAIGIALKTNKNGRKWETLVGYKIEELMSHLESRFDNNMTWDNYGEWEIDHIKPKSLFRYETAEDPEFKKCWALDNLQPLGMKANREKSNKFSRK